VFDIKNTPSKFKNHLSDDSFRVHVRNASGGEPAELLIMEQIGEDWFGDGVSASSVVGFLAENKAAPVNVRINSPGGLVYDGLTIFNALKSHGQPVTVTIEGLAFSAASFIAMAGDRVVMHEASHIGIHRSMAGGVGNKRFFDGLGEWLDQIDNTLTSIYAAKTGASSVQINEWLDGVDDGTLFSAQEALEYGFADEVIPLSESAENRVKKAATDCTNRIMASHKARLARLPKKKSA